MGAHCHDHGCSSDAVPVDDPVYRRVLWIALLINAGMFVVEIAAGSMADSVSLLADSLDFLSDAANYGISLLVLGSSLALRARAALVKGASLGLLGLWVAYDTTSNALAQSVPAAPVMGAVGVAALAANLVTAWLLYAHRDGDANRASAWICSRNDAIANLAVLAAALGVFGTGTGWPDIVVAAVMAGLALSGAQQIIRRALAELRPVRRQADGRADHCADHCANHRRV